MDDPAEPESTRSELGWWARSSLRDLGEDILHALLIGAVVVVPAVVGYLVAGNDGIVPGLGVGVGICAVVVVWWLISGARDLRRRWKDRGRAG